MKQVLQVTFGMHLVWPFEFLKSLLGVHVYLLNHNEVEILVSIHQDCFFEDLPSHLIWFEIGWFKAKRNKVVNVVDHLIDWINLINFLCLKIICFSSILVQREKKGLFFYIDL